MLREQVLHVVLERRAFNVRDGRPHAHESRESIEVELVRAGCVLGEFPHIAAVPNEAFTCLADPHNPTSSAASFWRRYAKSSDSVAGHPSDLLLRVGGESAPGRGAWAHHIVVRRGTARRRQTAASARRVIQ